MKPPIIFGRPRPGESAESFADRMYDALEATAVQPEPSLQDEYVYAEDTWANTGGLVCLPRSTAEELAAIWRALRDSKTWADLFAALEQTAPYEYSSIKDWWDECQEYEGAPSLTDEIGELDSLPGYADGDWPPWPEALMLEELPKEILALAQSKTSVFNGDFATLPTEREAEMLATFARLGKECMRDQQLVGEACGVGVKW